MKMKDFTVSELIERTRDKSANPGGGAITCLVGSLGISLVLMMDKKNFGDDQEEVNKAKDQLIKISEDLKVSMQKDIDYATALVNSFHRDMDDKDRVPLFENAIKPPLETIEYLLQALDCAKIFLEKGKMTTISDGEIGNMLIRDAIISSTVNVEINQKYVNFDFDKEKILKICEEKYNRNKEIIERRKK